MTQTARIRNRSRSAEEQWENRYVALLNGTNITDGPYLVGADDEAMTDVVVPNYRERIARGEIINNACIYERNTITSIGSGSSTGYKSPTEGWNTTGPLSYHKAKIAEASYFNSLWNASLPTDLSSIMESSMARAKQLAIANMDVTPYAFGEDAFEIRETLEFLRRPLHSLADLSRAFRKTKKRFLRKTKNRYKDSATALSKATASAWLQYQFAAAPLARSICDGMEAISYTPETKPPRLVARGFSRDEQREEALNVSYSVGTSKRWWDMSHSRWEDHHASIIYEVTNPRSDLRWRLGFRVKDLPSTLWQVVPLSFMVDRVIDVSSMVEGIVNLADPSVKILAGSARTKLGWQNQYQLTSSYTPSYTDTTTGENRIETHFEYKRDPWSPSVRDTVPVVTLQELVNTATKVADLAALVRARLK